MEQDHFDIAIIGGGLAGLSLAILLGNAGWRVTCIDREKTDIQTNKSYDIRTTAISWGSRNLLINAGIWADLEPQAQAINDILILDEDSPVTLEFNAQTINAEAFGWIVDNRDLRQTLIAHVSKNPNITHLTGQSVTGFDQHTDNVSVTLQNGKNIYARLIVGADGRNSFTRESMNIGTWSKDYKQNAIVCLINHTKPHNGLAIEHFRAQGPFAVLPFTDDASGNHRSAIVWTVDRADTKSWIDASNETFTAAIQERCGNYFGDISLAGTRAAWPLSLTKAYEYTAHRMCLVAEASHGIHPIAGQGLNMSLRDNAALTELLSDTSIDPGDKDTLKKYQTMRRGDNLSMVLATDALNNLFGSTHTPVRALRRAGLHAVSRIPFAKKFFMKQAMGALGHLPALIREVK